MTMLRMILAALAISAAPAAHADPTDDLICQESRMGYSPGQITDSVHGGQPNVPEYQQRGTVITDLGGCDTP